MGFFDFFNSLPSQDTVACYHCAERVARRLVVYSSFDGESRPLCCHGCATVLMMVEANGLTQTYLTNKAAELSAATKHDTV